jgi:hypothetical protein
MNGCESDSFYAIRGMMKESPYVGIFFSLCFGIIIFAYQLKIFEGPLSDASG